MVHYVTRVVLIKYTHLGKKYLKAKTLAQVEKKKGDSHFLVWTDGC
jgi:hypothetical protein